MEGGREREGEKGREKEREIERVEGSINHFIYPAYLL